MKSLKYETEIIIENIPVPWISSIECYYPDLPQFPIIYVHFITEENERVYGFPAVINYYVHDKMCDAKVKFLCNINLEEDYKIKNMVKQQIEERIGLSEKVGIKDIDEICEHSLKYKPFLQELWKSVEASYGKFIPYGRFYEEIYSIVRFVSAWLPKTGRQSEMRMLYNFMSMFGEKVLLPKRWRHLEFYIIPTYKDIKNQDLECFTNFKRLFSVIKIVWEKYFNKTTKVETIEFNVMSKAWPPNKEEFIDKITNELVKNNKINLNQKKDLELLVDAFNRNPRRATFFISSIMSIFIKDYNEWDKDFFISFYNNSKKQKGYSEKVIGCFLQQGFKKEELIPVDTWIECFFMYALGIPSKEEFFNSFNKMGKFERIIWLSSQGNKTNMREFFNSLWCTRFGNRGNKNYRQANPISCYQCKLRENCIGFKKIQNKYVLVIEENQFVNNNYKYYEYICLTKNRVPIKVYDQENLIDEFSGYLLSNEKTKYNNEVVTVNELVNSLPKFKYIKEGDKNETES